MSIIKRKTQKETSSTVTTFTLDETVESGNFGAQPNAFGEVEGGTASPLHEERNAGDTPWHHLLYFHFQYPALARVNGTVQTKLFANGRQQLAIRVLLSPRSADGTYIHVPKEQIEKALTLVDYNGANPLPPGWTYTTLKNEDYTYDESFISNAPGKTSNDYVSPLEGYEEDPPPIEEQIEVLLYVSTTATVASTLAASITPPGSNQPVTTHKWIVGQNPFESGVTVDPRPPLDPAIGDFESQVMYYNDDDLPFFTVQNQFIRLVRPRGVPLLKVLGEDGRFDGAINVFDDDGEVKRLPGQITPDIEVGRKPMKPTRDLPPDGVRRWEGVFTICPHASVVGSGSRIYDVPSHLADYYLYDKVGSVKDTQVGAIHYLQHMFDENYHFSWGQQDATPVRTRKVIFVDTFGNYHKVIIGQASGDISLEFGVCGKW